MNIESNACIDCGNSFTEHDRMRPKRNGYPYFPECCVACALLRQKAWKSKREKALYQLKKSNNEKYDRHRERLKRSHRKRTFGLTEDAYVNLFLVQGGLCACCGQPEFALDKRSGLPKELAIDHDHDSGRVRALLCWACNVSFGLLDEDPKRIALLLVYAQMQRDRIQEERT